jgi:hypothetical protein
MPKKPTMFYNFNIMMQSAQKILECYYNYYISQLQNLVRTKNFEPIKTRALTAFSTSKANIVQIVEKYYTNKQAYELHECGCCCDEVYKKDLLKCSKTADMNLTKAHVVCKTCLSSYINEQLASGNTELSCICNMDCKSDYIENTLAQLDPKLYKRYNETVTYEQIKKANPENFHLCPKCRLYGIIIDPDVLKTMDSLQCKNSECKFVSCLKCEKTYHPTVKCEYLQANQTLRISIEEILTTNRVRHCPNPACKQEFVRFDGCAKMTCSKCNTLSCYVCLQIINDYGHFGFGCKLYTTEDDIEKKSLKKTCKDVCIKYNNNKKNRKEALFILTSLCPTEKAMIEKQFKKHSPSCVIC